MTYLNGTPLTPGTTEPVPGTAGSRRTMSMVRACDPVPVGLVAVTFALDIPAVVGVPVMRPVTESIDSPAGSPDAPKLVGLLVAMSWWKNGRSVPPSAVAALVNTGMPTPSVMTSGCVAVAAALVALIVALKVPLTVGVPEITPVVVLTERPGGRPVAPKLVGLLVAVIW